MSSDKSKHVVIHELCYAIIRAAYPEMENLYVKAEEALGIGNFM